MPHEISTRVDGTAEAAFAVQPAWHGLGAVLPGAMTSEEALQAAQLNWEVVQKPLGYYTDHEIETPEGKVTRQEFHDLPGQFANVRSDNNFFLGTVSDQYTVVQNFEAFDFMDALVDDGIMQYESAFSIRGGKKVIITARMPEVDTIAHGDEQHRFILMSLSHDGCGAIKFGPTSVRVVCANTYKLALSRDGAAIDELSISHVGSLNDRLNKAREILHLATDEFETYSDTARQLAEAKLTRDQWEAYLDVMCPVPNRLDPDWTARRESNIQATRDSIAANFRNERNSFGDIVDTAWAAFNAVTEHVDHLPRRGATTRSKSEARFNDSVRCWPRPKKPRVSRSVPSRWAAIGQLVAHV